VPRLSRRSFVKRTGAAAAGALAAGRLRLFPSLVEGSLFQFPVQVGPAQFATENLTDSVVRPDDFAAFRFVYANLKISTAITKSPGGVVIPYLALERVDSSKPESQRGPAYIIVYLPPQNIAEQAYYEAGSLDPNKVNGKELDPSSPGYEYSSDKCLPPTCVPGSETPDSPGSVKSSLAEWSRLVFVVPKGVTSIPYRLDAILGAISTYELQVTGTALAPGATPDPSTAPAVSSNPPHDETAATPETAIEAPYRLMISPNTYARWAHSPTQVEHNGRVELWHTRLGVWNSDRSILDELAAENRTIRAIWSPDFEQDQNDQPTKVPDNPYTQLPDEHKAIDNKTHYSSAPGANANGPPGFRTSLDNRDRGEIVHLSSNFKINAYTPLAVPVNRLILSSLGAWIDLDGRWDPPGSALLSVQEWRHLATMGRDHYVKVVYAGWLVPFGHRASLVKVTERKLQVQTVAGAQTVVAYLRQRMYVVVREPVKSYPAPGQPWNGGNTPFKRLQITTLVTPDLADPSKPPSSIKGQDAFWVQVPPGQDFEFHFIATDWDGNTSEFSAPLVFVDNSLGSALKDVITGLGSYNDNGDERRRIAMNGQKIAFTNSNGTGKSTYETSSIKWKAEYYDPNNIPPPTTSGPLPDYTLAINAPQGDLETNHLPLFFPAVDDAQVRVTAIEELAGGTPTEAYTPISYFGDKDYGFLWNGFDQNMGEVFARFQSATRVDLSQNVEKVGGIITPSLYYVGLSRLSGAIPGDKDHIEDTLKGMLGSSFNPADALLSEKGKAMILGGMQLSEILESPIDLNSDDFRLGKSVPKLLAEVEFDQNQKPVDVLVTLHWEPPAKPDNPRFRLISPGSNIVIDAQLRKPFDPAQQPSYNVTGTINNVQLNILDPSGTIFTDLVAIPFNKLEYKSQTGGKTNVSAELGDIGFHGVLKFIEELSSVIPGAGFKDPAFIDVNESGITAGFNVGVPKIPVGAIIISDLKLEALLNIPFIGKPARLQFSISEREHPFTVTYLIFGGGGFFGARMGLDGIELMEGALEFGAYFSLDLGVASGGVHAAAGIYFQLHQGSGDYVDLSGYCRVGGELEVLGFISVSTEFYMSLGYTNENGQNACVGQAEIIVDVSMCLFSISVTLGPVEKKFSHSPKEEDLAFGNVVPYQDGWNEYAAAFGG
jgi:hypothetical protein